MVAALEQHVVEPQSADVHVRDATTVRIGALHVVLERDGRTEFDLAHIANAWGPHMPPEFVAPDDTEALCAAWESLGP